MSKSHAKLLPAILPQGAHQCDVVIMDLSGFDPSTMTYLATQMQHPNVGGSQDPFQEMLLPAEFADHHSTYGGYAGYAPWSYNARCNHAVRANILTGALAGVTI